jgi:hypothetical protein
MSSAGLPTGVTEEFDITDKSFTNENFQTQYKDDILGKACIEAKFTGRAH